MQFIDFPYNIEKWEMDPLILFIVFSVVWFSTQFEENIVQNLFVFMFEEDCCNNQNFRT